MDEGSSGLNEMRTLSKVVIFQKDNNLCIIK